MLHLARGIAFGVDVGDFLQLQRAFQRDGIVNAASQKEEIVSAVILLRQILGIFIVGSSASSLPGMRVSSASSSFDSFRIERAAHLRQIHRKQKQRRQLAR